MSKTTYKHNYTYLITNTSNGMMYIGVRSCNCEIQDDKYMGSSTHPDMKSLLNESPNIFTKKILGDFVTREDAVNNEIFFHNHYHVGTNPRYYNKSKSSSTGFDMSGISHSAETNRKALATKNRNGTLNNSSAESITKGLITKKKNGTLNIWTPELIEKANITRLKNDSGTNSERIIKKALATRKKNGTMNTTSPESIAKGLITKKKNGTMNNSVKAIATRLKNGTMNVHTPESIAKSLATRKKNDTMNIWTPELIKKANISRQKTAKAKKEYYLGLCLYRAYYNIPS